MPLRVELKVAGALSDVHVPQCRDYLRATGKPLYLLINFDQPKVEILPHHHCGLIASAIPLIPLIPLYPP